jgi:hypothetical protein
MRGQDVNGRIISKHISRIDFRDVTMNELVVDKAQWLAGVHGDRNESSGLVRPGDFLCSRISTHCLRMIYTVEVKVKLSLCKEDMWETEGIPPPFLTSALNGGERSASCPGRFTPEERDSLPTG